MEYIKQSTSTVEAVKYNNNLMLLMNFIKNIVEDQKSVTYDEKEFIINDSVTKEDIKFKVISLRLFHKKWQVLVIPYGHYLVFSQNKFKVVDPEKFEAEWEKVG